jgi:hypothetical protein
MIHSTIYSDQQSFEAHEDDFYDKALAAITAKDILKLSTGITKSNNDRLNVGIALMHCLARVDKSIQINEQKSALAKTAWNDVKKYFAEAREVHEQMKALR